MHTYFFIAPKVAFCRKNGWNFFVVCHHLERSHLYADKAPVVNR